MNTRTRVLTVLTSAAVMLSACKDDNARIGEAAAKRVAGMRLLGPNDVQMLSTDTTVALEVIGDTVHVFMTNSRVSVPATHIENLKYADGRLRFDIRGVGVRMFDVGDGTEGAQFRQADALKFVTTVVQRQAEIEARAKSQ